MRAMPFTYNGNAKPKSVSSKGHAQAFSHNFSSKL